jgi:hypothetical protein
MVSVSLGHAVRIYHTLGLSQRFYNDDLMFLPVLKYMYLVKHNGQKYLDSSSLTSCMNAFSIIMHSTGHRLTGSHFIDLW